jgi:hypothetical protein
MRGTFCHMLASTFQDAMGAVFFASFLLCFVLLMVFNYRYATAQDRITIVWQGVKYLNNHYFAGVGYYHAAHRGWFACPWNEFREGQGYYWAGTWHADPDQALVKDSEPDIQEISRVNELWCTMDPKRSADFQSAVQRFGFGISQGRHRREGQ